MSDGWQVSGAGRGVEQNLVTHQCKKRDFILCVFLHVLCQPQNYRDAAGFVLAEVNWEQSLAGMVLYPSPLLCFTSWTMGSQLQGSGGHMMGGLYWKQVQDSP